MISVAERMAQFLSFYPLMYSTSIRLFFCSAVVVIFLDIIPPSWPMFSQPKQWLSNVLNRVGLWQGQWSMFAPDPILNNAYLSAEFEDNQGNKTYWDSPDWKKTGNLEKFYGFRHLNFFNRIYLDQNNRALKDFADFLVRTEGRPTVRSVKFFRTSMSILAADDGNMPARGNTTWLSRTDFLTERRYDP